MQLPSLRNRAAMALAAAAAVCTAVSVGLLSPVPAGATVVVDAPVTGNATHFDALGSPYGGCGLPQDILETQNFVALNVFDTPGDYTFYPRPLSQANAGKMGIWNNGHNCGRWVRVTIGDYCTGLNDGARNQTFCRNGKWTADKYNGATLDMIVADSCGDDNAWCRDDPYHLDLATPSLNKFLLNGSPVGDMDPNHWNNRHIGWEFIKAPDYTGDLRIGFVQSAQVWWPTISVGHLPNGIHGVEYLQGGAWKEATMNGDMGQSFTIGATTAGGTEYQIRVRDVDDALLNNGRVYHFSLPCTNSCSGAWTEAKYTTSDS